MLSVVFVKSPYNIINLVYPNRFKPWEFKRVPMNYWTVEIGIEAIKWLFEVKLRWSESDIKEKLSRNIFLENGLNGMLQGCFEQFYKKAIRSAYPDLEG